MPLGKSFKGISIALLNLRISQVRGLDVMVNESKFHEEIYEMLINTYHRHWSRLWLVIAISSSMSNRHVPKEALRLHV